MARAETRNHDWFADAHGVQPLGRARSSPTRVSAHIRTHRPFEAQLPHGWASVRQPERGSCAEPSKSSRAWAEPLRHFLAARLGDNRMRRFSQVLGACLSLSACGSPASLPQPATPSIGVSASAAIAQPLPSAATEDAVASACLQRLVPLPCSAGAPAGRLSG